MLIAHALNSHAFPGALTAWDDTYVAGWAKYIDNDATVEVRISVGDVPVTTLAADQPYTDLGNHGFFWRLPAFGPGHHLLRAHAVVLDASGAPTGGLRELAGSPIQIHQPREYTITSSDGRISVTVDSRFGGGISKIEDLDQDEGANMVVGDHGGALMQPAFWLLPRHTTLPPDCPPDRNDMWYSNPTLGGFYKDVMAGTHFGNPIGLWGTDADSFDPEEFIRYEDEGRVVHFKSRFIRHDFCQTSHATPENAALWDTDFYLEQRVFFHPERPRTLVLQGTLSHVGKKFVDLSNRSLPIIFAYDVPRVAVPMAHGVEIMDDTQAEFLNPARHWVALLGADRDAGLGMVIHPNTVSDRISHFPPEQHGIFTVARQGQVHEKLVTVLMPVAHGVPNLTTIGQASGFSHLHNHYWRIHPGATLSWQTLHPIGPLDQIQADAEYLLDTAFDATPSPTPTSTPYPQPVAGLGSMEIR